MPRTKDCNTKCLTRMGSKKDTLLYEHNDLNRTYGQVEMALLCFCALHGFVIYETIPLTIGNHGGVLLTCFWLVYGGISLISASCLSELIALEPCTGATYHYCYYTICEFFAFLVGWNAILAYSSIILNRCSIMSTFIDQIFFESWLHKNILLGKPKCFGIIYYKGQLDLLVPVLTLSMTYFATWSVRITKHITTAVTLMSILIICCILIGCIIHSDFENKKVLPKLNETSYQEIGETVFFGFIGYDVLAVLGEESNHPNKAIPSAIMLSVSWSLFAFVIYTVCMTFAMPEETKFKDNFNIHPLYTFMEGIGQRGLGWLSNIGAIIGFWSGSYTMIFFILRIMYSMSKDGMLFTMFSKVSHYSKTPAVPTLLYGTTLGLIGAFINVDYKAATFSLVFGKALTSICLLITRYKYEQKGENQKTEITFERKEEHGMKIPPEIELVSEEATESEKRWIIINYPHGKTIPTFTTQKISFLLMYLAVITGFSCIYCILIIICEKTFLYEKLTATGLFVCFLIFMTCLQRQPQNDRRKLIFKVPSVPNVPAMAILLEFGIATFLTKSHWWLAFIWTSLGIIFYFSYSIYHSKNNKLTNSDGERWNPWQTHKKREEDIIIESESEEEMLSVVETASPGELLENMGISSFYQAEDFVMDLPNESHQENQPENQAAKSSSLTEISGSVKRDSTEDTPKKQNR